jgi:hypothetical protein
MEKSGSTIPSSRPRRSANRRRQKTEIMAGYHLLPRGTDVIGRIDIWGNDRYLRHVHRSSLQQILPEATHEVVLGDLFGSQWIEDDEFESRVHRYKEIIFKDVRPLAK